MMAHHEVRDNLVAWPAAADAGRVPSSVATAPTGRSQSTARFTRSAIAVVTASGCSTGAW